MAVRPVDEPCAETTEVVIAQKTVNSAGVAVLEPQQMRTRQQAGGMIVNMQGIPTSVRPTHALQTHIRTPPGIPLAISTGHRCIERLNVVWRHAHACYCPVCRKAETGAGQGSWCSMCGPGNKCQYLVRAPRSGWDSIKVTLAQAYKTGQPIPVGEKATTVFDDPEQVPEDYLMCRRCNF